MTHYSPTGQAKDIHPDHPNDAEMDDKVTKNIPEITCQPCIDILEAMGEYPRKLPNPKKIDTIGNLDYKKYPLDVR